MAHTIDAVRTRRGWRRHQLQGTQAKTLEQFFDQNRRQMTQVFWVDPIRQTTIQGRRGIRFSIPALTFEDQWGDPVDGRVKVEIIELTNKSDIILADRATTSGNQMLETGGAFYFGATLNNNPLRLGAPVQASVPISPRVVTPESMTLFSGRDRGGVFDWTSRPGAGTDLQVDTIDQTFQVTIRQPGWINCDHYYRLRRQQHYHLWIAPDASLAGQEVFLIYRTINTVVKLRRDEAGHFYFPSPVPMPSVVYGIGEGGGQFFQGFHPIVRDPYRHEVQGAPRPAELRLTMEPVLQQDIQSNLEEQLRFWDRQATELLERRYAYRRRWLLRRRQEE